MKNINPTQTKSWNLLEKHFNEIQSFHLREAFKENENRFQDFHIYFENILFDYSKNRISAKTKSLLIDLANECDLKSAIESMFQGKFINRTENRAVLHTALRDFENQSILVDNENILPKIKSVRNQMKTFTEKIISGKWKGFDNQEITDVVNIGIGGSDLGPVMVVEALKHYKSRLNLHFVSNIDGTHLVETLKNLNPERTLFIIASNTFNTQETMTNAESA